MNQTITDPRLMPAHDTAQISTPAQDEAVAGRNDREEVNAMGSKLKRKAGRAWDEMSATDRAVLLEAVRLRREAQEQRRAAQHAAIRATFR